MSRRHEEASTDKKTFASRFIFKTLQHIQSHLRHCHFFLVVAVRALLWTRAFSGPRTINPKRNKESSVNKWRMTAGERVAALIQIDTRSRQNVFRFALSCFFWFTQMPKSVYSLNPITMGDKESMWKKGRLRAGAIARWLEEEGNSYCVVDSPTIMHLNN